MARMSLLATPVNVRSFRVHAAVGVILVCGLIGTGDVLAGIPDGGGVIYGCYQKSTGGVRVIDRAVESCRSQETLISWNATGPTGPVGPVGPVGPAGPRGPSAAFLKDDRLSFGSQSLASGFVNLSTLTLPAGTYVAWGVAGLSAGPSFATAQCVIQSPTGALSSAFQTTLGGAANSFGTVTVTAAFTLTATTSVFLSCRSAGAVNSQPSSLTAIQVGTLTVQ